MIVDIDTKIQRFRVREIRIPFDDPDIVCYSILDDVSGWVVREITKTSTGKVRATDWTFPICPRLEMLLEDDRTFLSFWV